MVCANSGTSGNLITYQAYPGETPIFDGDNGTIWDIVHTNLQDYIVVDGIHATGAASSGIVIVGGSYVTVKNCHCYDNSVAPSGNSAGIQIIAHMPDYTRYPCDNLLFEDNTCHGNVYGIVGTADPDIAGCTIRGNYIYRNDGDGIEGLGGSNHTIEFNRIYDHWGSHGDSINYAYDCTGDLIIRYNRFRNSSQCINIVLDHPGNMGNVYVYGNLLWIDPAAWAPDPKPASLDYNKGMNIGSPQTNHLFVGEIHVFSNTTSGRYFGAILSDATTGNVSGPVKVYNNVWHDCATAIQAHFSGSTSYQADYNDYEGNSTDIQYWDSGWSWRSLASFQAAYPTLEQNSISSDPLFVDEAGFDFRLQSGSPCIGAGDPALTSNVTVPATFVDIDGATRTKDGGAMGAFADTAGVATASVTAHDATISASASITLTAGYGAVQAQASASGATITAGAKPITAGVVQLTSTTARDASLASATSLASGVIELAATAPTATLFLSGAAVLNTGLVALTVTSHAATITPGVLTREAGTASMAATANDAVMATVSAGRATATVTAYLAVLTAGRVLSHYNVVVGDFYVPRAATGEVYSAGAIVGEIR
jgi:hypothetical protein